MAKKLIHKYTFTPSTNTVVIDYIYKKERLLLINNLTDGVTIFAFNEPTLGYTDVSYDYVNETTTITLAYDCSAMSSDDTLQVFVEVDSAKFEPDEAFIDPVSKFRVSQPENLIDTDFEYGLQSTKWETLELVKNIPTFFSRSGDESFTILTMDTINGSDIVTIETEEVHDLLPGTPIIVSGSKNITCDGTFVVTEVLSTTIFQYKSKALQSFTGSIKDEYTQAFPGSVYQGTEFDLTGINAITTDAETSSLLTVTTTYPTDFELGTSFYLTNSVGTTVLTTDGTETIPENYNAVSETTTNATATGESGFALGATQPYEYSATEAVYFTNSDVTVDATTGIESITFSSNHGMVDNTTWLYVPGEGNTAIGGLSAYTAYYIRTISPNSIYLTATQGSTTRINLTSAGSNGGVMRSAFLKAYRATTANSTSEVVTFNENHGLTALSNEPILFFNGTAPTGLTVSTSLHTPAAVVYPRNVTANTASFASTPGGANINLTSTTANMVMVKASLLQDRSSVYFENHGLSTDSVVQFTVTTGTAPGGLTSLSFYKTEIVDANRIRFKNNDTGAVINLTSIGSTTGVYQIETRTPQLNNDSIYAPANTLRDGVEVLYSNGGNTNIGGLTGGNSYYVFQKSVNYIKLASTTAGWKTAAISLSSVNLSTNVITTPTHGFTSGDAVQYIAATPLGGLVNGAWYWVRSASATTVTLHWSKAGALANNDAVDITTTTLTGSHSLRAADLIDITSASTGNHTFTAALSGASDGVYTVQEKISDTEFTISANNQVLERELDITGVVDFVNNAFYFEGHFFITGSPVVYETTGSSIGGLTDAETYYIIRVSKDYFKLAASSSDADLGIPVTLTSQGTGTHTLKTNSVSGEVSGPGTVTIDADSAKVTGVGTNFSAIFSPGDVFRVYQPEVSASKTVSSINATSNILTSASHGMTDGAVVRMNAVAAPGGTVNQYLYYIRTTGTGTPANEFTLHPTYADAVAGTNIIDITTAGTTVAVLHITSIGSTTIKTIQYVNSKTEIILTEPVSSAFTGAVYATGTALLIRADGFALHRPYDGGVELIPSRNPDSQMIRQTRKYFRYQSGKGIQVSFAVNFSPSTSIDILTRSGTTATATTRYPHRLSAGLPIVISGATVSSGVNYWNDEFTVASIIDDYSFTVVLDGTPTDSTAGGLIEYYVSSWSNSRLKCGLFDDQNGLYFEYDGSTLYCVRRSSVQQISGTASVTFKNGAVVGTNTKFTSQLLVGEKIVMKGQSYVISKIASDTLLYILPSYRGASSQNVIITKTEDTKVPQSEWSIDSCDGTGQTGFYLNKNKIQMAYMDYSWYGAGKVRFGFKDQTGLVTYVHEFIHNNKRTEAYMRSGNLPARYEIENVGTPTYVPALAHWGTSIIMDGRFDDDKAYAFTANSNTISLTGVASLTVSARVEALQQFQVIQSGQTRNAGFALVIGTPSPTFNNIGANLLVAGAGIQANTRTILPQQQQISPRQPYLASIDSIYGNNFTTRAARSLLVIDRQPTTIAASSSSYTVTLSGAATPVVYDIPLISIRLSPSVDNGSPGMLGQREIINRMQLILQSVGILSTHSAEISLRLNGQINNNAWQRVTNPSLSQLLYHTPSDTITGGTVVYSFRAQGGSGTTSRSAVITTADLGEIATLGNSILGGDNIFPDGPDVLTVVAKLVEDPSTVSATNAFSIAGRISWAESQA
jgi:hypothetical protein